jgi:thiosulfate/3-mercaptopyruvate sulfurtransferase
LQSWNFLQTTIEPDDFVIDCRSLQSFQESTYKGAYYFPFIKKAYGSDTESNKKIYYPLQKAIELFDQSKKSRVIVFDEGMGMYAARMTFFLRCIGIQETYMYGAKWETESRYPQEGGKNIVEAEIPTGGKVKQVPGIVDKAFMEKNLTRLQIFDTRTKEEYNGEIPRLINPEAGTLCGRLPGAFLFDWMSLYTKEGQLLDKAIFHRRMLGFPFMPERTTVIYDYNGARSCLLALMLKEIYFQDVNTYQGSWFEWRKSSLPKQAVSLYGQKSVSQAAPRVGGIHKKS